MRRLFGMQPKRPDRAIHGYMYYRWTERYMAVARFVLDRPGFGWLRQKAGRWLERTHHAKVVPAEDARRLVLVNQPLEWRSLERVVPYDVARDIVLDASPTITLAPCACREVARGHGEYDGSCGPLLSCLYVGDPIASFVATKQPNARIITSEDAVAIIEQASARGNIHTLWFKDAAGGRMYAICNCCSCCCVGMKAKRAGFSPLAASGFLALVDAKRCTRCGICAETCSFDAVTLHADTAYVDPEVCMGCGACVTSCPAVAITLETGGTVEPLPAI